MKTVFLTLSENMGDAATKKLIEGIKAKHPDCKIETSVSRDLIGGFLVECEGVVYDYSISSRLKQMGKALENSLKVEGV